MNTRIDDRWLWLGFGVFFVFAARSIRFAIKDTLSLTRVHDVPAFQKGFEDESPEESITLETLKTLMQHPNPNIANAAINILVKRVTKDEDMMRALNREAPRSERERLLTTYANRFLDDWMDEFSATAHQERDPDEWTGGFGGGALWADDWTDAAGIGGGAGSIVPSAQNPIAGWTNVPLTQPSPPRREVLSNDEVFGEEERRRRRREAIVLHEGDGELNEDDIIQPL